MDTSNKAIVNNLYREILYLNIDFKSMIIGGSISNNNYPLSGNMISKLDSKQFRLMDSSLHRELNSIKPPIR